MNINKLFDIILDFIGTLLTESSLFGDLIKYIAEDGKVLQPPDIIRKHLAQKSATQSNGSLTLSLVRSLFVRFLA